MKFRLLSIVIAAVMIVALNSCSSDKNSQVSQSDKTQTILSTEQSWNPEVSQRNDLKKAESMCGVHYVGYAEEELSDIKNQRKYYDDLLAKEDMINAYPFLKDMPDNQFVGTKLGHDLYIVIPADPNAHVDVKSVVYDDKDDFAGREEDTLYASDTGAPFVLQCNYSDIFSDAVIKITDSEGNTLRWSPFISLRDGRVATAAEDGKTVYDFTAYSFSEDD